MRHHPLSRIQPVWRSELPVPRPGARNRIRCFRGQARRTRRKAPLPVYQWPKTHSNFYQMGKASDLLANKGSCVGEVRPALGSDPLQRLPSPRGISRPARGPA